MKLDWKDFEDIGIELYEKFPDEDPLKVRFTDLKDKIFALENFGGDKDAVNEQKLEAVQMAWLEEYQDNQ